MLSFDWFNFQITKLTAQHFYFYFHFTTPEKIDYGFLNNNTALIKVPKKD